MRENAPRNKMVVSAPLQLFTTSNDWTVTLSCTLGASSTAPANVIVDNGAVLTIPNAETLGLDFTHYHLYVSPGGGVYIAPGGKIS
ncbi:MAG: hypothetical protein WCC52_04960 [Nitrosotalea sp.]